LSISERQLSIARSDDILHSIPSAEQYIFECCSHLPNVNDQSAILEKLTCTQGIVHAIQMDQDISNLIAAEEESVRSMTGIDVVNKAYKMAMDKDVRICIFCDKTLPREETSTMLLEDSVGNVMGAMLPPCKIHEYKDRKDVIWVSEDFIIFPEVQGVGKERFVLLPMHYDGLDEKDGCCDVVMCSPAPSSDAILKRYYGRNVSEKTSTLVIAYNLVCKC